jgi:hypothetical protein
MTTCSLSVLSSAVDTDPELFGQGGYGSGITVPDPDLNFVKRKSE